MVDNIQQILTNYANTSIGVRCNMARILNHGATAGTGRIVILAVDQGFEHGPLRSFSQNPAGYDPTYHFSIAIKSGVSAIAAPLGFIEAGIARTYGMVPTILKINSSNTLTKSSAPNQAVTANIDDALRLGCSGIGFTIYPGSADSFDMFEELQALSREAKEKGLVVVVWSYPRGDITKEGETALDIASYGAHMACLLGADIVKCKTPTSHIALSESKDAIAIHPIGHETLTGRIRYMLQSCFDGKRIIIFSGGAIKDDNTLLTEVKAIHAGGGSGSIIGRNVFQRPENDALKLIQNMQAIYTNQR